MLIFLLSAFSVAALSEVTVTPLNNQIMTGEKATFSLYLKNTGTQTQCYKLYSLQSGQKWIVDPYPVEDKVIVLAPGKDHTTTIDAQPSPKLLPGIYFVYLNVQSYLSSDCAEETLDQALTEELKVYLGKGPLGYQPVIKTTIDLLEKINPQEPLTIKLTLENKNLLNLSGMKVRLISEMPEFAKDVVLDLPPLEKKTLELSVIPNAYQQPKKYFLIFDYEWNNKVFKEESKAVEVIPLTPPFSVEVSQEEHFFKIFKVAVIKNTGNLLNTQQAEVPLSFWQALFTSGDGKVIKEDGQRYLAWKNLTLAPGESTTVHFAVNYRILFYLLIFIILFVSFYLAVQPPVAITKSAIITKTDEEGALSGIKVTLEVRNKSKKPLKDVTIVDIVPTIAVLEKGAETGSVKPQKIVHTREGVKVSWNFAELEAEEHRVITYKMRAKLNILGLFSLPRATAEFIKKKGKVGKAYSRVFSLGQQ